MKTKGQLRLVLPSSSEEGITTDWTETNMGFHQITIMVNHHRRDEGRGHVRQSTTMNTSNCMPPKLSKIIKTCQGDNKNNAWILAPCNHYKQNLIIRGLISRQKLLTKFDNNIPNYFDPLHFPFIVNAQILFLAKQTSSKRGVRYPRLVSKSVSPNMTMANTYLYPYPIYTIYM